MSKRGGDLTRIQTSKVKKRRGVGSRIITVLESDDEDPLSTAASEYARVTRIRVATSGKTERVATSSVPIFEEEQAIAGAPLEENTNDSVDAVENIVATVPAKQQKKANDSVSGLILWTLHCALLRTLQTKMFSWLNLQSTILDEMVSLDGPGDDRPDICSICSDPQPTSLHRCLECSHSLLCCGECIIQLHKMLPLHRLEVSSFFLSLLPSDPCHPQRWQNGFFNRTSLYSLGFVCHLGHKGDPCPIESSQRDLVIVDVNGWHKVRVGFCECGVNTERYRQLLRMRWYPASFNRPRTAASFDLLDTYHKLTLQGKLNLYDFYHSIMQKADNQGRLKTMVSDLSQPPLRVTQDVPIVSLP